MRHLYKISYRSLAVPFYEANVAFFMVLLYFAFGILTGREHKAIAVSVAVSLPLVCGVIALWGMYVYKAVLYIRNTLGKPQYQFMHMAALLPYGRLWMYFVLAQLIVNLPVIAYALYIIIHQIQLGEFLNLSVIVLFIGTSVALPAFYYAKLLAGPLPETKLSKLIIYFNKRFKKPFVSWFWFHLINNKPGLTLLSKLLSLGLLASFFLFYGTDDYDWRVLGLAVLFGFSGNLALALEFNKFENEQLLLFKNIPIHSVTRLWTNALLWFTLLVPEFLLALRYFPDNQPAYLYFLLMLFGYTLCLAFTAIPQMKKWRTKSLFKFHFIIFWTLFVYLLFGYMLLPVILLLSLVFIWVGLKWYRLGAS